MSVNIPMKPTTKQWTMRKPAISQSEYADARKKDLQDEDKGMGKVEGVADAVCA